MNYFFCSRFNVCATLLEALETGATRGGGGAPSGYLI